MNEIEKLQLAQRIRRHARRLEESGIERYEAYCDAVRKFDTYPDVTIDIIEQYDRSQDKYVVTHVGVNDK